MRHFALADAASWAPLVAGAAVLLSAAAVRDAPALAAASGAFLEAARCRPRPLPLLVEGMPPAQGGGEGGGFTSRQGIVHHGGRFSAFSHRLFP